MNHNAPRRTNILVMHDNPLLSAGLVATLRQHPGFDLFADDIDSVSAHGTQIDIVIGDYATAMRLSEAGVRTADPRLAAARIMALTSHDREAGIRRAIEAGVHGHLLLGIPLDELIEGVTTVANGARYMCRAAAERMADSLTRTSLTSRELEVLQLVVAGEANKAIARQLHIEVGTVKSHVSAIMTKLEASSRTQAARIAAARGLVKERMLAPRVPFAAHARRMEPRAQFA